MMGGGCAMMSKERNRISGEILDSCIEVHSVLGPGLLESVYETCLAFELKSRGIKIERQVPIQIVYKGNLLGEIFKLDLYVENEIIVELKSVDTVLPVHKAQLLTYLKLKDKRLGLLINFNVPLLKDGFSRIINGYD
jgi:GxxExxY protein